MSLTLDANYINSAGERMRIALKLEGIDLECISVGQIGRAAHPKTNLQGLRGAGKLSRHAFLQRFPG